MHEFQNRKRKQIELNRASDRKSYREETEIERDRAEEIQRVRERQILRYKKTEGHS